MPSSRRPSAACRSASRPISATGARTRPSTSQSAKGARLTDIDGNEYIDYRLAYGPCILGYADPRVDAAARAGIDIGGVFALSTEREYAVAERIASMVPAAELVRFSNSGTEAVMAALRVARAYTGKDSYVVIEGGYHGVFDAALWTTPIEDWKPGPRRPAARALQRRRARACCGH